jgi:hypothetical protein
MLNFPINLIITKDNINFSKKKFSVSLFSFLNNQNIQEDLINKLQKNNKINLIFSSTICTKEKNSFKIPSEILENLENIFSQNNFKINGSYISNKYFIWKIKPEKSNNYIILIICFFIFLSSFQYLKNYTKKQNEIISNLTIELNKINDSENKIADKSINIKIENNKKYFNMLNTLFGFPLIIKNINYNMNTLEIVGYVNINQMSGFLSDFDIFINNYNYAYKYNFEKINDQFIKTNIEIKL